MVEKLLGPAREHLPRRQTLYRTCLRLKRSRQIPPAKVGPTPATAMLPPGG
jgi:hypothetical protein